MKLLAFAASSSSQSINKQLVSYVAGLLADAEVEVLDLNDYELPLFSQDRERELGQPQLAKDFLAKIAECDALVISFAEHNGSYSAAYKNLFDWCSRINNKVYQKKPIVVLATSPGGRGGANVLATAVEALPRFHGEVVASVSVPNFHDNFDVEKGEINNSEIRARLLTSINKLKPWQ